MKKTTEQRMQHEGVAMSYWCSEGKRLVVFCLGLPQYPSSYHPFIQTLVSCGYDILIPKYKGTYESVGEFSLQSSIETVQITIKALQENSLTDLYTGLPITLPRDETTLVGFSYGGFVARFVPEQELVKKLVLLMPFVDVQAHGREELKKDLAFLEKAYSHVYRCNKDTLLKELEEGGQKTFSKPYTLVAGTHDNTTTKEELLLLTSMCKPFSFITVESGHTANLTKEEYARILS
jgi:esterase/lipase